MANSLSDQGKSDFTNLRQHPRAEVDLKTDFKILSAKKEADISSDELVTSNARTLGEGGLLFVSRVPLAVGTRVDMKLYFYSLTIEFVAEVVWMKEQTEFGTSEYFCGSKYAAISNDNFSHLRNILRSYQTH
ncbi:MAG: PilZ domain-containing protein [Nitrospirae bacterium]|nr:PilZ domain-containing protein [Nitrospirota bacterium]